MHSNAQQCAAMRSNAQQCAAMRSNAQQCAAMRSNAQQCAAMRSNAQQCAAMRSNAQQCAAMRSNAQQCAVLRSSYWNSAIQLTNVPLYHIRIYATHSLYFTCPQGLRTDHPVLVYKTCEFSGIVLRLFSCLPPRVLPLSPSAPSCSLSSFVFAYHKSSFGTVTSNFKPLSPPTTPLSSELRQRILLRTTHRHTRPGHGQHGTARQIDAIRATVTSQGLGTSTQSIPTGRDPLAPRHRSGCRGRQRT